MELSDFVRDKVTEWGLSEFMQKFEGNVLPFCFGGHSYVCK